MTSSLLRDVLARGILGGRAVSNLLNAPRNFSCAPVANNQLLMGIRGREAHHRILTATNANANYQLEKVRRFGTESELVFSDRLMAAKLKGSNLPPIKPEGCYSDLTEDQIIVSASYIIEYVDKIIKNHPGTDFLYGAPYKIYIDSRFQTYDEAAKMKVLSRVLDVIENYPGVDNNQVFVLRMIVRSFSVDDGLDILTKEQVVSRVIDVVQSHPLARQYKVTTTMHFCKDLHLDFGAAGHICLIRALRVTFKMHIPDEIDSSEHAVDYIYANQEKRVSLQECRDHLEYICPRAKDQLVLKFIELRNKFLAWLDARLPDEWF